MHAFDVLGDPVRRRILELLAEGEHASGEVVEVISREFGITQSAVSQQLKVLRESGFATVRAEGTRRVYAVDARPLAEVDAWLDPFRRFWGPRLEALATEIARGKRAQAAPLIRPAARAQALAIAESTRGRCYARRPRPSGRPLAWSELHMRWMPLVVASLIAAVAWAGLFGGLALPVPSWLLWVVAVPASAVALNELLGRPIPFLRWSFLRLMLGMRRLTTEWQVGDGREQRVVDYVRERARPGDIDDAIRVIDDFGWNKSMLINVGDKKGPILDEAVRAARPKLVLELGTYIGYSALRLARRVPEGGRVCSVEFNASNAELARRIIAHAGAADRVAVIVGTLGDGGATLDRLAREHGFSPGSLDLVFLDHAKEAYLTDLHLILERGWLHPGSVVVADNVKFPGAPEYRAYMHAQEGKRWRTAEHAAPVEYQSMIQDLVLVSEYQGA